MKSKELRDVEEMICPVCGYYCSGNGGRGCVDKKSLYKKMKKIGELERLRQRKLKNGE